MSQPGGSPQVSVMMPCYNARDHLPWALASLLVQTCDDWELVLVDDGSTDRPDAVVEQVSDPRIRLLTLPQNRGRGFARQVALDNARGEFLAMLDADDWMYPQRLERELDVLSREPSVGVVSAGMALTNADNEITGVRLKGDGTVMGPHRGLGVPMAHAPSMFRRSIVGGTRFDTTMGRAEDADFLRLVIQGQRSIMLPDLLYVYQEATTISGARAIAGQQDSRYSQRKYLRQWPYPVVRAMTRSLMKEWAYRGADLIGANHLVTRNKQQPPSEEETLAFHAAREIVAAGVSRIAGG